MPPSLEELESRLRETAASAPGSVDHVDALNAVAWEIGLRHSQRAKHLATDARSLAEAIGDRRGRAFALRTLGYCHIMFSELREGLELSRQAAEELRELGDRAGEATAVGNLGIVYSRLGDFDKALELALEGLRLNEDVGDARGVAWAHVEMGNVQYGVGDYAEARKSFERALAVFREIGYGAGENRALTLLGNTLEHLGETDAALGCFQESLSRAEADGFALGIAGNSTAIGRVHHRAGNVELARDYYLRALDHVQSVTVREMRADILIRLAELELETNELDEARARLEQAHQLIDGEGLRRSELRLKAASSKLYEREGELTKALSEFEAYHRLHEQIFSEEGRTRLRNLQIRAAVEHAEKEAEIQRLRFVELAGVQARLVQAERMAILGRLVAGLSHELNNPVGVVSANASLADRALELALELLEEEGLAPRLSSNPRWVRAVETLRTAHGRTAEAAERVAELVRSLKSYARLDEAERARVAPSTCLRDAARLIAVDLPKSVAIVDELRPLPEIECSPGELNQAFMTLLANARDAIEGAGSIVIRSKLVEDEMVLEIADTGRGIPPERIGTLFDFEFTRKQSQIRFRMGLAHARQVFEEHGGGIEVESRLGAGTTFRVRLPIAKC